MPNESISNKMKPGSHTIMEEGIYGRTPMSITLRNPIKGFMKIAGQRHELDLLQLTRKMLGPKNNEATMVKTRKVLEDLHQIAKQTPEYAGLALELAHSAVDQKGVTKTQVLIKYLAGLKKRGVSGEQLGELLEKVNGNPRIDKPIRTKVLEVHDVANKLSQLREQKIITGLNQGSIKLLLEKKKFVPMGSFKKR